MQIYMPGSGGLKKTIYLCWQHLAHSDYSKTSINLCFFVAPTNCP